MRIVAALLLTAFLSPASEQAGTSLERGEKLLGQKQYAKAEKELRRAVEESPSSPRAHGNLALALLPQKKTREAVDEARLAAAFGPESPEARFIYGLALSADGRPVEAARELEKAVALKPGQAAPLAALAATYAAAEDERTVATYESVIELRPGDAAIRGDLAEYLWRTEKTDQGNRVMEEVLRAFPGDAELTLRYGRALVQQERYLDAAAALEKVRRLESSTRVSTYSLLGTSYTQAGKVEEARATLEAGVKAHPRDPSLQHELGRLLLSQGQTEQALPHLKEAALGKPSDADIQLDLGRAEETLGHLTEAEAAYRAAVKLSPGLPRGHYALGRLLMRTGNAAGAERELAIHRTLYERARQLFAGPAAQSAEAALGWAELNQGRFAEALARFQSLPETTDTLLGRATALSRLGRHTEAVRVLERSRQLAPEDHAIERLLATERSRAENAK